MHRPQRDVVRRDEVDIADMPRLAVVFALATPTLRSSRRRLRHARLCAICEPAASEGDLMTVHAGAEVAEDVVLGDGTTVWPLAQIREGARLGAGCIVGRGAAPPHHFVRPTAAATWSVTLPGLWLACPCWLKPGDVELDAGLAQSAELSIVGVLLQFADVRPDIVEGPSGQSS